jgi:pilus assembly protein Flp/PilA
MFDIGVRMGTARRRPKLTGRHKLFVNPHHLRFVRAFCRRDRKLGDFQRNETGGQTMMMKIRKFVENNKGATAIEYGLIAALIAVALIGTLTTIGSNLDSRFEQVDDAVKINPDT